MKTTILTSDISTDDLNNKLNEFVFDGIMIHSQQLTVTPMRDFFYDGNVCNQWVNYTLVIFHN